MGILVGFTIESAMWGLEVGWVGFGGVMWGFIGEGWDFELV